MMGGCVAKSINECVVEDTLQSHPIRELVLVWSRLSDLGLV